MQTPARTPRPTLLHLSYYKAPPVDAVTPAGIPGRMEVIELITNGVVYFHNGEGDREFGRGALFWHLPGEETIHRTRKEAPYECLVLGFHMSAKPVRVAPRVSVIEDHLRVKELCYELLRDYHNDALNRSFLGNYAYHRFLWEAHGGTVKRTATLIPMPLEAALTFLEAEFRRPEIGVADLAKAAGLSEPRIHVLFRQFRHQTPYHVLTARRIQEAKWLLTSTSRNIKTLSQECGFANLETFYRAFKKEAGMTPHRFRAYHTEPPHF